MREVHPNSGMNKCCKIHILRYYIFEQDSSKVFSNTDIKGGVVITYHDRKKNCGAIGTFTAFDELNSILKKRSKKSQIFKL